STCSRRTSQKGDSAGLCPRGAQRGAHRTAANRRGHRRELAQAEDHLRSPDIVDALDGKALALQIPREIRPAVVGDVFVGIATGRQAAIEPLERAPPPAVVIRSAEDQPSAGFQYPGPLVEGRLLGRDVLN